MTKNIPAGQKKLVADWQTLMRTFIRPEDDAARNTLLKYMEQILFGLHEFLKNNVGFTEEQPLKELGRRFTDTRLNENPEKKLADVITDLIEDIAPYAVNVASPYFVGHMTSAIPFFMVHLKTIVAALNQNVVKLETSKIVSVVEKQLQAKIHRLIFQKSEDFYREHVQNPETTLGVFIEDGTLANITALWVARNKLLSPKPGFGGIEAEGVHAAYRAYGIDRLVVLVSALHHYSISKAAGVLGIGNSSVIAVDVDSHNRIDLTALESLIDQFHHKHDTKILAVIGIAGATETGTVDPLEKMAAICSRNNVHFHVDAAWGGPTLMSNKYRHILEGIASADSVTIDGHKQFYMPMTCGMVYFRDPTLMDVVTYHSNYVIRHGSADLGIKSLAGSREAVSLILDSALKIMGTRGYSLLIEHGIETARQFAHEILSRELFQLVTPPELNILTYRICPESIGEKLAEAKKEQRHEINEKLNHINMTVQRMQREAGKSFVSRTTLTRSRRNGEKIVVFRSVIMNPMTTIEILRQILDEQEKIFFTVFENHDVCAV
ncbi:MAG: putative pyridoxal-dependent aspartate 1-decarboxylase [Desulfobacterales bacterium]